MDCLGELGIDGMDIKETGWSVGWIQLAQDRTPWWVLVNMVMNLRFHKGVGIP